jgi:hypothetical protein
MNRFSLISDTTGPIGHQAPTLGLTNRATEIGFPRETELALSTFRRVEGDDVISHRKGLNLSPDLLDDPSALVPEDRGEEALGVIARQGECVRMADPRGDQSH